MALQNSHYRIIPLEHSKDKNKNKKTTTKTITLQHSWSPPEWQRKTLPALTAGLL